MGKKKNLLINVLIIGIGKFSSQIIVFLMLPLYTSQLSTGEYGIYDTLISIATFLVPFITMLFEESMFRYLIEYRDNEKKDIIISNTLIFCISNITIFTFIYCIFCMFFNFTYKWYFLFYIIFNVLYIVSNAIARGLGEIKIYSISNFIANVCMVILNLITILLFKLGVRGLFISYCIGIMIAILFVIVKIDIFKYFKINKFDKKLFKEMFKYSLPLVPNSISWSIINVSDRVMLTSLCSSSLSGIYSVSNKFPQVMGSVYNFFSIAWKESASVEKGDTEYYSDIFNKIIKLLFIAEIFILCILPTAFNLIIAREYIDAYKYIPILLIAMLFSNISEFFSGILIAYKKTKVIGITTMIAALINIIINFICIKRYGIWAAAFSTMISTFLVMLIRAIVIQKIVQINLKIKTLWKYIICTIISIYVYYLNSIFLHLMFAALIYLIFIIFNLKDIKIFLKKRGEVL